MTAAQAQSVRFCPADCLLTWLAGKMGEVGGATQAPVRGVQCRERMVQGLGLGLAADVAGWRDGGWGARHRHRYVQCRERMFNESRNSSALLFNFYWPDVRLPDLSLYR